MNIRKNVSELVGNTPIIELSSIKRLYNLDANIYAKLECFNPSGSAKDRAAMYMLDDAERRGLIKPGSVIIEPTSGNTGIGLAAIGASRGYRVILTMSDTMSMERRKLLTAYGAEVVLTDGSKGMQGSVDKAEELAKSIPNSFIPGQFVNPANCLAHKETTGPEIWRDTDGKVDIFVAGIGTGGTISGTGEYLKSMNPSIQVVGIEPTDSPLLTEGRAGKHGLQGIGANFVPDILNRDVYDKIVTITTKEAYDTGRFIARNEGLLLGITSGAAIYGAVKLARLPENCGKNIVCLCPDGGDRYMSTTMFND